MLQTAVRGGALHLSSDVVGPGRRTRPLAFTALRHTRVAVPLDW